MSRARQLDTRPLIAALIVYAGASLFQHVHNALFLSVHSALPSRLSVLNVYAAWAAMSVIGLAGYVLLRQKYLAPALIALVIYGACGLDGLAHYVVAEFSAHPVMMHAAILLETVSGIILICLAAATAVQARRLGMLRSY
ncbi:MAG: hypothetical protein C0P74_011755 [Gammaproteobacteria bacterium]|nr:hypothetical protein [Gammaproteobacteria bacterium]